MNKKIITGLNDHSKQEIISLLNECNRYDETTVEIHLENRDKVAFIDLLYYEEEKLVGYLVIIPTFKQDMVRIMGMVHPSYRNKGIFTELVEKAKEIMKPQNKNTLVFVTESSSGIDYVQNINAIYQFSSYLMNFDINKEISKTTANVEIVKPKLDDVDHLIRIGMEAFNTDKEEEEKHVKRNITDPNRNYLIAKVEGHIVGNVSSNINENGAVISDLAVLKEFRNRGIGNVLLQNAVKLLLDKQVNKISLYVQAKNNNAINLYIDNGFSISKKIDFYELKI